MKNILLVTALLVYICQNAFAQHEGKRFLSGLAGIDFQNQKEKAQSSQNAYNVGISTQLGKFKTNNRAEGFFVDARLVGGKSTFAVVNGEEVRQNGISGAGGGVGYFWQYYRHFNANTGIFAGPNVSLSYDYVKSLEFIGQVDVARKTGHYVTLAAGLSAGAYYTLTERWWLTASLGFSTPLELKYSHNKSRLVSSNAGTNTQGFVYDFSPSLVFPSVRFGVRYILK